MKTSLNKAWETHLRLKKRPARNLREAPRRRTRYNTAGGDLFRSCYMHLLGIYVSSSRNKSTLGALLCIRYYATSRYAEDLEFFFVDFYSSKRLICLLSIIKFKKKWIQSSIISPSITEKFLTQRCCTRKEQKKNSTGLSLVHNNTRACLLWMKTRDAGVALKFQLPG